MSTTIAIITTGALLDLDVHADAPVFATMLDVASGDVLPWGPDTDFVGQVIWHTVAPTYAIGYATDMKMVSHKIAVVDLDNTNARDAIILTGYVNNLVDDLSFLGA